MEATDAYLYALFVTFLLFQRLSIRRLPHRNYTNLTTIAVKLLLLQRSEESLVWLGS